MSNSTPFSLDRFEYEDTHLYYLPKATFGMLKRPKPTYIVGTRGTGKTTLLHALDWREQLHNESLRRQIGGKPLDGRCVGVYLKMPSFKVADLRTWLSKTDEQSAGSIFGFYLDLVWLELLFDALSELLLCKIFVARPSLEHDLAAEILERIPEIQSNATIKTPRTFKSLARAICQVREVLEQHSTRRTSPKSLATEFRVGQVGFLGRTISPLVSRFCGKHAADKKGKWHFKVCMDEAECLGADQQRVLNTMVRLSEWPTFFVVAFGKPMDDLSSTLLPHMALQRADRQLKILDSMKDDEFRDLAEGVATARVREWLGNHRFRFSADKVLGKLDLNRLIQASILRTSEGQRARDLKQAAEQLASTPFLSRAAEDADKDCWTSGRRKKSLPIYQAYIIEKLKLPIPSPDDPQWKRRNQQSREIRKRMVAAYLCLCRELKAKPRYAFADMVLQMSDKCIRDFLSQLHAVFAVADKPLRTFLKAQVPLSKQHEGLEKASIEKRDSLTTSGVIAPIEIGRIVFGLAEITASIQSHGSGRALRSVERGRFVLDRVSLDREYPELLLARLEEAHEAGFLRIIKNDSRECKFRVHCSLAAAFGFSYRGAYYDVRLEPGDVEALRRAADSEKHKTIVRALSDRLSQEGDGDLPLFKGLER